MAILAFETSCDETSAAVVRGGRVLSNVISSQVRVHAEYGGVVPELASRMHLQNFQWVAKQALQEAGVRMDELTAVAATQGPGLPNALLCGLSAGQAFALARSISFIPVHHHEAHLYSPWIQGEPLAFEPEHFQPHIALIVSGGHTMVVLVDRLLHHQILGSTVDDAAGECFDKVAKLMGLPYPGGVFIDRLARGGNSRAAEFPRPMLHSGDFDFSFSGLKTAVRYHLRDHPGILEDESALRDLCASVQAAIVDVLVKKCLDACRKHGVRCLTVAGGVAANSGLRSALEELTPHHRIQLRLAPRSLCGDNAAMVGVVGELRWQQAAVTNAFGDLEPRPRWGLEELVSRE